MPLVDPAALAGIPALTPDDISWGWAFGRGMAAPGPNAVPNGSSTIPRGRAARTHLETRMRELLADRRVVVTFSGGRDSSTILAVATHVARAEGLPEPVALTLRFPGRPDANEADWQELVIGHLGIADWEKALVSDDDADLLGPYGQEVLLAARRPVFPFGSVVLGVQSERAAGAHLVTGEFGDAVLGAQRLALANAVLARRGRAPVRIWAEALRELVPVRAQHPWRPEHAPDWLRSDQERRWLAATREEARSAPLRWDTAIRACGAGRAWQIGRITLPAIAKAYGTNRVDPLGEPAFVDALACDAGPRGFRGRTDIIRHIAGDLLPESVITRQTKTSFNTSRVGKVVRSWAAQWMGNGVDPALVNPEALHRQWLSAVPSARSLGLLQQAWLAGRTHLTGMTDRAPHHSAVPGQAPASRTSYSSKL